MYHKVANTNMSRLEAHAGFFRLLMKGIFDAYVHCNPLHGHYRVELLHREIPVICTGNGFAVSE